MPNINDTTIFRLEDLQNNDQVAIGRPGFNAATVIQWGALKAAMLAASVQLVYLDIVEGDGPDGEYDFTPSRFNRHPVVGDHFFMVWNYPGEGVWLCNYQVDYADLSGVDPFVHAKLVASINIKGQAGSDGTQVLLAADANDADLIEAENPDALIVW